MMSLIIVYAFIVWCIKIKQLSFCIILLWFFSNRKRAKYYPPVNPTWINWTVVSSFESSPFVVSIVEIINIGLAFKIAAIARVMSSLFLADRYAKLRPQYSKELHYLRTSSLRSLVTFNSSIFLSFLFIWFIFISYVICIRYFEFNLKRMPPL